MFIYPQILVLMIKGKQNELVKIDDSIAGQRLLHAHQEPDRLSCRHPPDALLQFAGIR